MSKSDWNNAPYWAEWKAQDFNGDIWFYQYKPTRLCGEFDASVYSMKWRASKGNRNSNWENTLEQRPKKHKENTMSNKTIPHWRETVHLGGEQNVVIAVWDHENSVHIANQNGITRLVFVNELDEYRPRTTIIGGMKVPEPVREPMEYGEVYYRVNLGEYSPFMLVWEGSAVEHIWLKRGLIQKTVEGFYQHQKALILISGGETE